MAGLEFDFYLLLIMDVVLERRKKARLVVFSKLEVTGFVERC